MDRREYYVLIMDSLAEDRYKMTRSTKKTSSTAKLNISTYTTEYSMNKYLLRKLSSIKDNQTNDQHNKCSRGEGEGR
jgi:hypothetical protein